MERNIKVLLNGHEVFGYKGQKLLDLCAEQGIQIPTLCYDKHLSLHGGCSVCLVEVKGAKALVRACAMEISDGMDVKTDSERAFKARKLALELLLSDHKGDCRPPCTLACPGRGDVQAYVNYAAKGAWRASLDVLHRNITLPASIGRVCPAPCEKNCRRQKVDGTEQGVAIREVKRFVGDWALAEGNLGEIPAVTETGKRVAVIGGGPAGLSAAYFLRLKGHAVDLYEKEKDLGGMMRYGIPSYRLPREVLRREAKWLVDHGVVAHMGVRVGKDIAFDEIREKHDAVVLALGAWKSSPMRLEGEGKIEGVVGGIDFLYKVNNHEPVTVGRRVVVVGGGNTAMDACRCAKRLGAEKVTVLYRRTRDEMPADPLEIQEAMEEGVEFLFLAAPVALKEQGGKLTAINCQRMKLGEPDKSGRRSPVPIEGDVFDLEADMAIAAIGQTLDLRGLPDELHDGKRLNIQGDYMTEIPGVFAAGDVLTGPDIAVAAIGGGHWAAESVDHFLRTGEAKAPFEYDVTRDDLTEADFEHIEKQPRTHGRHQTAAERLAKPFEEYNWSLSEKQVLSESSRCMECGCEDLFECKLRKYAIDHEVKPERVAGEHIEKDPLPNPYYLRNMDKCILCGRCVRACDEVAGYHAIDFRARGFEAKIDTPFGKDIEMSDCVFCGQCVQACPVGALTERRVERVPHSAAPEKVKTTCPYCGVGCELELNVDRGTNRVVRVTTDFDSKTAPNKGRSCVKGRFGFEFIDHPDRLTAPLIRDGEYFREASWDEALGYIAARLGAAKTKFGPDALAFFGSAKCTNEENYLLQKFARSVVGTNNITHCADLCHAATVKALGEAFGSASMSSDYESIQSCDVFFLIGCNPTEEHPVIASWIKERVRSHKAKLIVADARRIEMAKYADLHVRHKPGTDLALINGMLRVILEKGLFDESKVRSATNGFDEMKQVVAAYTPAKVAEITGVPAEQVVQMAELFAKGPNAAIYYAMGITQQVQGVHNVQALANLVLLAGSYGRPGTGLNPLRGQNNVQGACDMGVIPAALPGAAKVACESARKRVAAEWGVKTLPETPGLAMREMLDEACRGNVRALFVMGCNPMLAEPDLHYVEHALSSLDFLVVQDIFMTETAEMADVVLPAAAWAEKEGTFTNTARQVLRVRKAVEPPCGARADLEALVNLANRMGAGWSYDSANTVFEEIRRVTPTYAGISYKRLEKELLAWPCPDERHPGTPVLFTEGFKTADGKGNFMAAAWRQPEEWPDEEYPMLLSTGRILYHYHTGSMTRRTRIADHKPEVEIELHPADAERIGVQDGEFIRVTSRRGYIEGTALVTERVPEGLTFVPFHFAEAAANVLTTAAMDPESKTPEYKICAVRVEPA